MIKVVILYNRWLLNWGVMDFLTGECYWVGLDEADCRAYVKYAGKYVLLKQHQAAALRGGSHVGFAC